MSAVATVAVGPTQLDPLQLFLDSSLVVQAVMIGLILASVWTWALIVSISLRIGGLNSKSRNYETDFWETQDRESVLTKRVRSEVPSARVAGRGWMNGDARPKALRLIAMPPVSGSAQRWKVRSRPKPMICLNGWGFWRQLARLRPSSACLAPCGAS